MFNLGQQPQTLINRAAIIAGHVTLCVSQAYTDNTARIRIIRVVIENLLQFVVDLRPDIPIGITIGLIIHNVDRTGQARDHLDI